MKSININNLYPGQIIPNYRKLCKILEIEANTGHTKIRQLKELALYCRYSRQANKYIIDEIYDTPKDAPKRNNYIDYDQYKVNSKFDDSIGVYKITLDNEIYIGSTIRGFRARFIKHMQKDNNLPTLDMLKNNACFEILWIAENGETEKETRQKEKEYIKYYSNNPEWICVNKRLNKKRYKTIKVLKENYTEAIKVLKEYKLL